MPKCLWCEAEFKKLKPNQRFCPGGKCRSNYHNNEAQQGLPLTPELRQWLTSIANDHEISANELLCRMLEMMQNPNQQPMDYEVIFGNKKEKP